MLCPEVWNFEPPVALISSRDCKSEDEILHAFKHQYFNHSVSVVIPNANQVPKELVESCLDDSQYYKVNRIPGAELVKKSFVDHFIRRGSLTGFSVTDFPEQDRLALTPCGKLIFSFTKSTFQTVGIEGIFNKHFKSTQKKFNLLSDFNECELLEKKLLPLKHLCFDILLAWEPHDENVCPSSIAHYFHQKNFIVKSCEIVYKQKFKYSVSVPNFDVDTDLSDFVEWLGVFSLYCDNSSDSYTSSMKYLEKQTVFGQVIHLTFIGLLTQRRIHELLSKINRYAEANASFVWISTVVQAFQDSIINVKNGKFFLSNGDQHKTVIFSKNQLPVVYSFKDITK